MITTLQWRGGAPRRRYLPLPSSPRGVSEIPEDRRYEEAEPVHPEGGGDPGTLGPQGPLGPTFDPL